MKLILLICLLLISYCCLSQKKVEYFHYNITVSITLQYKYYPLRYNESYFLKFEYPINKYYLLPMNSYMNYKNYVNKEIFYKNYYIGQIQQFTIFDQCKWIKFINNL